MASILHPWFKPRKYPHFDRPVNQNEAERLVSHAETVARHAFLPFLHYIKLDRRYKREKAKTEDKERPIAYAAHSDSAIFSFYAYQLSREYEATLRKLDLVNEVLAYRRFTPSKCNIEFARDCFALIQPDGLNAAIGLDVEKFFDSLDSGLLKAQWCRVLGVGRLPDDHFAVFRAITQFSRVERNAAFKALGIGRRRALKWRGPLCTPKEFREKIRQNGLIEQNPNRNKVTNEPCGIPQGSPISAILSNIYMITFDLKMRDFCTQYGAVYRRYSDDILIICRDSDVEIMKSQAKTMISEQYLVIQDAKTNVCVFKNTGRTSEIDKAFQYLGFVFDGKRILLRSQSIARYYRRLKSAVRASKRTALRVDPNARPYRFKLYDRFSHLHQKQRFSGYVYRAAKSMNSPSIRSQFKRHWPKIHRLLEE